MSGQTTVADLAPLTRTEERAAIDLARADRRLRQVAGNRHEAVLAQSVRAERRSTAGRHALVGFYDYDKDRSVVAVVDLKAGKVRSVQDAPAQYQLAPAEIRRAEQLAKRDPTVRNFLDGRPLNPLTRLYFPPWAGKDDPPHRYAIVFARPSNSERRYAIVDLSAQRVAEVLTTDHLSKA